MAENNIVKAIDYFEQSLDIAESIDAKSEIAANYQHLSMAYAAMKDFSKSSSYMDSYTRISKMLDLGENAITEDDTLAQDSLAEVWVSGISPGKSSGKTAAFGMIWVILFCISSLITIVLLILLIRRTKAENQSFRKM